jgi:hypothetical protein
MMSDTTRNGDETTVQTELVVASSKLECPEILGSTGRGRTMTRFHRLRRSSIRGLSSSGCFGSPPNESRRSP